MEIICVGAKKECLQVQNSLIANVFNVYGNEEKIDIMISIFSMFSNFGIKLRRIE